MKATCIGIWMDHANAHLMELASTEMVTTTIASTFTHEEKKETLNKGEKAMHHKEQQEELAFYQKIAAVVLQYEEVLLFGPTNAKLELMNILKDDHRFDRIHIEIRQTDKMTENQQYAFMKEYFSNT